MIAARPAFLLAVVLLGLSGCVCHSDHFLYLEPGGDGPGATVNITQSDLDHWPALNRTFQAWRMNQTVGGVGPAVQVTEQDSAELMAALRNRAHMEDIGYVHIEVAGSRLSLRDSHPICT